MAKSNDAAVLMASDAQHLREVRHTVIRVITAHLQPGERRAASMQD